MKECGPPHGQWQPTKVTINASHSHPNPRPRPANMKAARLRGKQEVTWAIPFLNPDLIVHLVGQSNEAPIIVDGQKVIILKVHPIDRLLKLEGTRQVSIPFLGYVEVDLQIPGIGDYSEDIVLLVIPTMTYAEKVPVMVGFKIIDRPMGIITKGQPWPGDRLTSVWSCLGHSSCLSNGQGGRGDSWRDTPFNNPWPHSTLVFLPWTTSLGMFIPHEGLPFLHLEP